ncbi:hypothetical protein F2P56_016755 [Juglans regia]|uniref:Phytocyanin domain-containing protein n=1 Tax=Juglans regia TaxID=51240 RepID=A0A833XH05_JUGRE|nr:hypothetical protein F2P56_016755 [Juglans regia]
MQVLYTHFVFVGKPALCFTTKAKLNSYSFKKGKMRNLFNTRKIHFLLSALYIFFPVYYVARFVCFYTAFRYQKNQYNVFEVNQTGYDNCTTEGAVGNWSSGKDFIPLNAAKRYYFICGNGQCYSGMKVSVLVHPLPPPPSSSIAHLNPLSDSAAPVVLQQRGFGVLIVSFAISWLGSGWMWC